MNTNSEKLFGALIGLARAGEGNEDLLTPDTEKIIIAGLHAIYKDDEGSFDAMRKTAGDEKYRIVPDCATCANPCGRTFDYDFTLLENDDADVVSVKKLLYAALVGAGERAYECIQKGIDTARLNKFFYRGVYAVGGLDWPVDLIMPVFFDCGETAMKYMSLNPDRKDEYTEMLRVIKGESNRLIMVNCENADDVMTLAAALCYGVRDVRVTGADFVTDTVKTYFADNYGIIFE